MAKLKEIALKRVYCESCGQYLGSVLIGGYIKCDCCGKYSQAQVEFTPAVSGQKSAVPST